ncbi:MAG: ABC transporter permease [Lachnospirales bacterium]
MFNNIRKNWGLYFLLLPSVILLLLFAYKPMYGVIIAFKNYKPIDGIWGSQWVGLQNFIRFFNSFQFTTVIKNTVVISLYGILAQFPLPIIFALTLNQMRQEKFKKVFQTITYMPHFISTVVMVGLILIFLSPSSGLIGVVFGFFGKEAPNLMGMPKVFSSIYVWTDVWQHTGWDSIIYLAALAAVDVSLYEASTVDGASRWQKILYIDLPMLLPTATVLLILRVGRTMSVGFEKVYLMQNNLNLSASEIISTYVYKTGILDSQYSYSAAIELFNTIVNLALLVVVNKVAKKVSGNSLL